MLTGADFSFRRNGMSNWGKTFLVLTILAFLVALLPIPGMGYAPRLLVVHNQWSRQFRDSGDAVRAAIAARDAAEVDLHSFSADVESITYGWGRLWRIPARGPNAAQGAPTIQITPQGALNLQGVGNQNGLKVRTVTTDNGNAQLAPTVFAFYTTAEGVEFAGEFTATNITNNSAVLRPVRQIPPELVRRWQPNVEWRIRSLVPPAHRNTIDNLYTSYREGEEALVRTAANIARQQTQLEGAKEALRVRRGELLGNPDATAVEGRPEFNEGLLKVIEDTEEERNQLQLDIDALRRSVQDAEAERSRLREELLEKMRQLPGANPSSSSLDPAISSAN